MRLLIVRTCLLLLAVATVAGCRTRLPLDAGPGREPVVAAAAQPSDGASPTLAAFLAGDGERATPSRDPLAPFLGEIQPDRLQDMVRMDLLTDRRRGPFAFLTTVSVCVPGEDHGR